LNTVAVSEFAVTGEAARRVFGKRGNLPLRPFGEAQVEGGGLLVHAAIIAAALCAGSASHFTTKRPPTVVIISTVAQTEKRRFGKLRENGVLKGFAASGSPTLQPIQRRVPTLHRKFRYARAAYFGLCKVSAQSHLKAMCLNLLKAANRLSVPVAA